MSFSAAAQDSSLDDGKFLGYIGPTTEEERKNTMTELVLEAPKPPSNLEFGQNGELVLIQYGEDKIGIYGMNDTSIDGKLYTESKIKTILKNHFLHQQPSIQYAIYPTVESRTMMRRHEFYKTLTTDISLFIMQGTPPY